MRSVLASELLQRLREVTGTENDTHVTTQELYRALTSGVSDTWDMILSLGIGTEGVKWAEFSAVPGTQEYDLADTGLWSINGGSASALTDFYQVSRLLVNDSEGRRRPVSRVNPSEQYMMRAPTQAASMRLYYFPVAPSFTVGTESFDGINGWEEHTIMCAAIHIRRKKEDDTGQYRASKREIEERMKVMANRMRDEPPRVVRRTSFTTRRGYRIPFETGYGIPYDAGVRAYDLRGGNLELFA